MGLVLEPAPEHSAHTHRQLGVQSHHGTSSPLRALPTKAQVVRAGRPTMASNPLDAMDLDNLEAASSASLPSSVPTSASSWRGKAEPPKTPPSSGKRRKVTTKSSPGAVVARVKGEAKEELGADGPIAELELGSDEAGETVDKICHACARPSTGPSWIRAGEVVQWALPESRGLWCRDCFTVWRLRFSGRMRLMTMPSHFKNSPSVAQEFETGLVALISLRREGCDRVTAVALGARMELLRWAMEAFGTPVGRFVVAPLSEVSSQLESPSQLVTLRLPNGAFQIGAMIPETPTAASASSPTVLAIQRPICESVSLKSRRLLCTSDAADEDRLAEVLAGNIGFVAPLAPPPSDSDLNAHWSKSAKRATNMVRSAISAAMLLLYNFSGDDWEEIKESAFTKPLQQLMEAKLEAAHEQVEGSIKDSQRWHSDFSSPKMFVKKYREMSRSRKGQSAKLGAMDDVASVSYVFLKEHVVPSVGFNMIRLKCKFYSTLEQRRTLAERYFGMVEVDLYPALASLDAAAAHKADQRLRSVLLDFLTSELRAMASEDVEVLRVSIGKDCGAIANNIKEKSGMDTLSAISFDLYQFQKLCFAGVPNGPRFIELEAAEKHLMTTARLALLKEVVCGSAVGAEFLAPLKQMKTVSANDELGDQRFALGADGFEDVAMLRVTFRLQAQAPHPIPAASPHTSSPTRTSPRRRPCCSSR